MKLIYVFLWLSWIAASLVGGAMGVAIERDKEPRCGAKSVPCKCGDIPAKCCDADKNDDRLKKVERDCRVHAGVMLDFMDRLTRIGRVTTDGKGQLIEFAPLEK